MTTIDHEGFAGSPLNEKVAVITGAGSGIGRATCTAMMQAGAAVVAADYDDERLGAALKEAAGVRHEESGPVPVGIAVDVRDEDSVASFAEQVLGRFGAIDFLVCCAGILRPPGRLPRLLVDMPLDEWEAVIGTNLRGTFLTNRTFLRSMISRGSGHIVNVSSTAGRQGKAYDSAYCASKFGVLGMTESLAEEVRRFNVKVTAILPDAVDTPLWCQNGPIPRPPDALAPERVAELIVYLVTMPQDVVLVSPVIKSFSPRPRPLAGGGSRRRNSP
jgi:NAD(P)-dependent dehydrogenase (short-subunit alcohol dehydrogenase family)